MTRMLIPALLTLVAAAPLAAQEPRGALALNLLAPIGSFQSTSGTDLDNQGQPYRYQEGYDLGIGGQLTFSFPLDPKFAFRLNLSGHSIDGSNTAPGYAKVNLRHVMFSLGGEMQLFLGSAYRHKGTYFLGGLSADFERFDRSFDDLNEDWADVDSTRKSRLGGTVGIGHTFGYDAGTRFTLEAAYHTTLTGHDALKGDPPRTEFLRLSFGWVF